MISYRRTFVLAALLALAIVGFTGPAFAAGECKTTPAAHSLSEGAEFVIALGEFQKEAGNGSQEAFCSAQSLNTCPGWGTLRASCSYSGNPATCTDGPNWAECNGVRSYCPNPCASNGICNPSCSSDPDCNSCLQGAPCEAQSDCGSGVCDISWFEEFGTCDCY